MENQDFSSSSVAASPHWQVAPGKRTKGFSPFIAFCFTINYVLGTGFLTLPWAFTRGGLLLSVILLILAGIFADMAKNYILETLARAEAMLDINMHWIKRFPGEEDTSLSLVYSPLIPRSYESNTALNELDEVGRGTIDYASIKMDSKPCATSSVPVTPNQQKSPIVTPKLMKRSKAKYRVKSRKFEVNTLCRVFLGKTGLKLYTIFICLYIYFTLWAYTSVFSSSMAQAIHLFRDEWTNYTAFAIIFSLVVVPMSCLELDEQVGVQVTLTFCRFLMLFMMITTCKACAKEYEIEATTENKNWFRPEGIHEMLPIIVFATIFHHSIPGLSHPVQNKRKLRQIFQASCVFTSLAYGLVGLILGSTFGKDNIEQSSNLNWKYYKGRTTYDENGNVVEFDWLAKFISLYIILFPAVDVVSAFPLNAITLGNNMMGSFFGSKIHEYENNRWVQTQFRLLAACPPILLGIQIRDLGKITDYAGTTGFIIAFSIPALLFLRSKEVASRKNFLTTTLYESYASSNTLAWFLFIFGICMMLYVTISLSTDSLR